MTEKSRQEKIIWILIAAGYAIIWLIPCCVDYTGKGEGTLLAESILRDYTYFKWYVIPLLLIVINAYSDEIRNKNLSAVFAGLAFFLMDAFNEIWNGLFFTASGKFSAVWMCSYPTAYQPLMGWNIEIIFMFLLMGIAGTKLLPEDKNKLVFGKINNRHFIAIIMAWMCVIVEIILNLIGALKWNYWWWKPSFPWLIFLTGYLPFWMVSYHVYDMEQTRDQIKFVSIMAIVVVASLAVFIPLGWL